MTENTGIPKHMTQSNVVNVVPGTTTIIDPLYTSNRTITTTTTPIRTSVPKVNGNMLQQLEEPNVVVVVPYQNQNQASTTNTTTTTTTTTYSRSALNSVVAGYCAGITGTLVGHPLDSLKVWLQTSNGGIGSGGGITNNVQQQTSSTTANAMMKNVGNNTTTTTNNNSTGGSNKVPPVNNHTNLSSSSTTRAMSTLTVTTAPPTTTTMKNNNGHVTTFSTATKSGLKRLRSLYAGVGGPLATVGIVQSINFALYDTFRRMMYTNEIQQQQQQNQQSYPLRVSHSNNQYDYLYMDSLYNVGISSMAAGVFVAIITNPMLLIKTRQQTYVQQQQQVSSINSSNPRSLGFFEAYKQIIAPPRQQHQNQSIQSQQRSVVVSALYKGFGPHFIAEVFGRGVYFVTYEYLKRQFVQYNINYNMMEQNSMIMNQDDTLRNTIPRNHITNIQQQQQNHTCTIQQRMISAAGAGILCWTAIFPFDVVRCRLYAADHQTTTTTSSSVPLSTKQMIQTMYQTGGIRSFYRGFIVTIIRAGPVAAFVLPVYDLSLEQIAAL